MKPKEWAMIPTTAPTDSTGQNAIYNPDWYAQVKVDGVRVKVTLEKDGDLQTLTKNGNVVCQVADHRPLGWTAAPLQPCVMDGELVRKGHFYPFDLLEVENVSLVRAPHRLRMEMLHDIVPESEHGRILKTYDPKAVWAGILAMDGEGMVVKNPESPYIVGPSTHWVKVKYNRFTSARVISVEPDKNGLTVMVESPETGQLFGKVHTTLEDLLPDDLVTIRYCQHYPDGRLREMYLMP